MLEQINAHPRDSQIIFYEEGHKYVYLPNNTKFISVTTIIHEYFPKFDADKIIANMMGSSKWTDSKYYGMTPEQIKKVWDQNRDEAANSGTKMHKRIENFYNQVPEDAPMTTEYSYFLQFWKEFQHVNPDFFPYRSEWIVYDEGKNLAGSIDFILSNKEGELVILDWKRSKSINTSNRWQKGFGPFEGLDDCNYMHYTIQLNCYRHILETKYNKTILGMYLVILHPNQICAEIIPVEKKVDIISALWERLPLNKH